MTLLFIKFTRKYNSDFVFNIKMAPPGDAMKDICVYNIPIF